MRRNRIALNWIYLRSVNGPDFNYAAEQSDAMAEIALHRFFQTLRTPYRAYQARNAGRSRAGGRRSRQAAELPAGFPRTDSAPGLQPALPGGGGLVLLAVAGLSRDATAELAMKRSARPSCCSASAALGVCAARRVSRRAACSSAERVNAAIASARVRASTAAVPEARVRSRECVGDGRRLRGRGEGVQNADPERPRRSQAGRAVQPRQSAHARGFEERCRQAVESLPLIELAKQSYRRSAARRSERLGCALQPRTRAVAGAGSGEEGARRRTAPSEIGAPRDSRAAGLQDRAAMRRDRASAQRARQRTIARFWSR